MKIQFIGAIEEVTGSKVLLTTKNGKKILIDCGMYQGKGMKTDAMNRDLGYLVCSLKNYRGKPFNLPDYVDFL
ncbi:MAG: hypothetical protein FWH36_09645 [Lentimicrobiaceae bacterium]|nr:hypothetical protein [Lentimicrobiaceae bacterium]